MILTDSTAVCGPADFSLKDEANRKKLKNFIIEQLYPDDPDGWRAALSVFAVPVWNRFETVWYAPQEIVGFAPKIRRFSEYSTVQQNVFKCRLYEVLQDLSSRAGAFTAVTGEQRLLVSCLSDPAGVFGLGRAMYFDPEKDLYVINDRNPVIIRWGVISEGGNRSRYCKNFSVPADLITVRRSLHREMTLHQKVQSSVLPVQKVQPLKQNQCVQTTVQTAQPLKQNQCYKQRFRQHNF